MEDYNTLKNKLITYTSLVQLPDDKASENAARKWNSIGKPLGSFGKLEKMIIRISGIQNKADVSLDKRAVVIMCGDHGVVDEGVSQTDSSVTRAVAESILKGTSVISILSKRSNADVYVADMGMKDPPEDINGPHLGKGTGNIAYGPAMTMQQAAAAVLYGIEMVGDLSGKGYDILAVGEMGIGSTTPSSALASVLLDLPSDEVTGRGAGLSDEGLAIKIRTVEKAIMRYWEAVNDSHIEDGPYFRLETGLELISQLGGYEIAGLAGLYIGAAVYGVPIILDGFISLAAAMAACLMCKECAAYMIASHYPKEPGALKILKNLHLDPVIKADLCHGEGTGAVLSLELLDAALDIYDNALSFSELGVVPYKEF